MIKALGRELRDGRSTTPRRGKRTTAFPGLACKGNSAIRPIKEQLDEVV